MTSESEQSRIEELEADNRRLRRLLDQRDAPSELRHRLRSTTALLVVIVRRSTQTERDLSSYAAHLEDRLDAIIRAQTRANQYGEVDLRTLVADELLKYGVLEGERLVLAGPDIRLTPKSGQTFALAIHELAINAVEHGRLDLSDAGFKVSWTVADQGSRTCMHFVWAENNGSVRVVPSHRGFGTEVLERMLPYELRADARLTLEGEQLRYVINIPDLNGLGRVVTN